MTLLHPLASLFLSLFFAWVVHIFYRMYTHRRWFKGLPQPPHSFLWGHLKVMGEVAASMPPNMHPQAYLTAIAQKYDLNGIFYIDLWPIADSQVLLTDPDLMNQVTVTKPLPVHRLADDFLAPVVGRNNIATSNGSIWKKTHNAMAPAFSWSHIRNLTEYFIEESMHFRNTLDHHVLSGDVFSMEDTAARLIFDIISRVIFNFPLHAQTGASSYFDDLREMIRLAEAQLSFNPLVKVSAYFQRKVVLGRLHPSIVGKIKERMSILRRDNIIPSRRDPSSILDLMLREQLQEDKLEMGENSAGDLSPEYMKLLVTNIKGLLVGGHGTTTDTLCYIYMLLSKSPEVLQKVRDEHTTVFHKDFTKTIRELRASPQKLGELEYTSAVIKETLRLFPVGFGVREAKAGATLNYDNQIYPIDNNLVVVPLSHALHYDAKFFSDPAKFQPERFMDPSNSTAKANFRTFGRGPRACLGQNLALDELKVILLMTLRDYDFESVDLKPNPTPRTDFTDLDTVFGDLVFQELAMEAKPRGPMMTRVRRCTPI